MFLAIHLQFQNLLAIAGLMPPVHSPWDMRIRLQFQDLLAIAGLMPRCTLLEHEIS